MRNVQHRGFKHCGNTELSTVLACGFREITDIVVRIVHERRVIIHGSDLVELFGLITCEEDRLGQAAKLLVLVLSALDPRFWVGKVRQDRVDGCVGEVGLEVTVQEQQGRRVKHEEGDGEVQERDDMRMQQTPFLWPWAMRVCDTHEDVQSTQWARCAQKHVRATSECVYTSPRTLSSCYYVETNLPAKWVRYSTTKKQKIHHSMTILREHRQTFFEVFFFDLFHQDVVH